MRLLLKEILKNMFDGCDVIELREKTNPSLLTHKFFEDGSRVWFPCSGGSYYFTGTSNSKIQYTDVGNQMILHIDTDFKNYNDEIENFLDWIAQYIDATENEFLGYSIYEESSNPTLYFLKDKKIVSFTNNNVEEYW